MKENEPASTSTQRFDEVVMQSLGGVYLWLFFGYLSIYINCDLQRILRDNPYVLHVFGFFTFFFLFTSQTGKTEPTEEEEEEERKNVRKGRHPAMIFAQTAVVYTMWVLASKMKWYFIFTVLGIVLSYQIVVLFLDYYLPAESDDENEPPNRRVIKDAIALACVCSIGCVIVFGVLDYLRLQKIEYKENFSYWKFFVERGKCKYRFPDYSRMQTPTKQENKK